jgi:hypothetical protein
MRPGKVTLNDIPCTQHVDGYGAPSKQPKTAPPHLSSDMEPTPKADPPFIYSTPTFIDPVFRRMDTRAMVNADHTCTLETLRTSTDREAPKESVAESMLTERKTRMRHAEGDEAYQGAEFTTPFAERELDHTFRRGDSTYQSELNEHTCSWEDLERAGVVFDAR